MLLQLGDKGDNVKYLQYGLHILCCSPNGFDGEFGNGTLTAVKKFQSKYGLVSDGIVGDVTWNTLKNEIATIQAQLNKKGCSVGTVDGIAGPATYNAVISFQNKNGLTADGQVGTATWDILFDTVSGGTTYTRILKVTSPLMQGDDVKAVQNKLNSLGYNCGTADGYYGNATRSAVISFQSAKGLTDDGEVGPATWNALFNSYSSSGSGTLPGGSIKVFIDAGHGGTDPGAVGNGLKEKDIVLSIATKLGSLLNGRGISIKYSRTNDTYLSLEERARLANACGADLFLSIHANSATSSVRGTECYTHPTANTATKTLSGNVSRAISSKFGNFAVLRLSNMPAILVETAFISNSSDANLLNTRQTDFSIAIANSILSYFNGRTIDTSYILSQAKNIGLLKGTSLEFAFFEAETPIKVVSLFPKVTMSASVSVTQKFNSSNSTVMNFSVDSNGLSTQFINKLGENSIDFSTKNKDNLAKSIEKVGALLPAGIFNIQAYTSGLGAIFKIEYPIAIDNLTFYHCITIAIENYRNPSTTSYSFVLAETASNPATNLNVQPVSMLLPGLALMAVLAAGILAPPAAATSAAAGIVAVVFLPIIQKIKN